MDTTFWRKQKPDQPLFPDLLWSRPEHRKQAGKLLVIGGNLHGFAAPAEAFVEAGKAGAGTAHVLLPDAVKKLAGGILQTVEYASSTPSGSFSQKALAELMAESAWADAVLVAGDLGRNSETAILLEKFAGTYTGQLTLAKDAVDYVTGTPRVVLGRPDTLLVLSFAQLQKLAAKAGFPKAFTFGMDLLHFVDTLHEFTTEYKTHIIVKHLDQIHIGSQGQVVSTVLAEDLEIWRVKTAAQTAVWWMQNPTKPLEALATGLTEVK